MWKPPYLNLSLTFTSVGCFRAVIHITMILLFYGPCSSTTPSNFFCNIVIRIPRGLAQKKTRFRFFFSGSNVFRLHSCWSTRDNIYFNWRLSRGPCVGRGTYHGKRPEENYGRYVYYRQRQRIPRYDGWYLVTWCQWRFWKQNWV